VRCVTSPSASLPTVVRGIHFLSSHRLTDTSDGGHAHTPEIGCDSLSFSQTASPPLTSAGAIVYYTYLIPSARSSHALETQRTGAAGGGGRRLLPRFAAAAVARRDPARRRDAVPQYPRAPKYLRSALVRVCYVR